VSAVAGPGGDFSAWIDTAALWAAPDARFGRTLFSLHHEARALLNADLAPAALTACGMLPAKGSLAGPAAAAAATAATDADAPTSASAGTGAGAGANVGASHGNERCTGTACDAGTHAAHLSAAMMALYRLRRDADADAAAAASAAGATAGGVSETDAELAGNGPITQLPLLCTVPVPAWLLASHSKLLSTPKRPTPAAQNPVIDDVCSGNRQTCSCGAPFL